MTDELAGPVIELASVSKQYVASGSLVMALDSVSLVINAGDLAVVLGPSGAGKTTLLNLVAGLEKPTKGEVKVLGNDLARSDENSVSSFRCANIGFVFQSYNLVSTLTAGENVELMMELAGWQNFERNEKLTRELVGMVGLEDRMSHLPSQLSGGEQQRIAIARALANDPPLVLADEPTGNLDRGTGQAMQKLLRQLNEEVGQTFVIVTHDREFAAHMDRAISLVDGKVSAA